MPSIHTGIYLPADPEQKPSRYQYSPEDLFTKFREDYMTSEKEDYTYLEEVLCPSTVIQQPKFQLARYDMNLMLIVDESGLLKELPHNPYTGELYPGPIAGNALIVAYSYSAFLREYESLRGIFTDEDAQAFVSSLQYRGPDRR